MVQLDGGRQRRPRTLTNGSTLPPGSLASSETASCHLLRGGAEMPAAGAALRPQLTWRDSFSPGRLPSLPKVLDSEQGAAIRRR